MKMEQREVDNMLLSMIQKHFPSLPLSDEHTDWGKWLGFARAVYEAGRASPASVPGGMELSAPTILPDGSGFGILSLPLPKDHWLYAEREYEEDAVEPKDLPAPILTHALRQQVIDAIRYAVRSATNCGKEDDFDPDALVQNAVYALCGPYGAASPTPPVSEDRWLPIETALKSEQYSGCITPKLHEVIEELQAKPPKREDVDALCTNSSVWTRF